MEVFSIVNSSVFSVTGILGKGDEVGVMFEVLVFVEVFVFPLDKVLIKQQQLHNKIIIRNTPRKINNGLFFMHLLNI
jgi:hypothetical protein